MGFFNIFNTMLFNLSLSYLFIRSPFYLSNYAINKATVECNKRNMIGSREMNIQVDAESYFSRDYDSKWRFISYWHQLNEIIMLEG